MNQQPPKLLIVDDDEEIRSQMKWALTDGYSILEAEDRSSTVSLVREELPDVVCLDLGLPPQPADVVEGLAALEEILNLQTEAKIIVITGQGDTENALRAIELGAFDFFSKPIEIEVLKIVLKRAVYLRQLEIENKRLHQAEPQDSFEGMIGTSEPMQKVFSMIRKVATSDAPVLLSGESGTGKELAAKAIHKLSRRKDGPFIPINCGAIPENLLESELFGHEKGSFTGAHMQTQGQIETAQSGTLFLDEIGEMPPSLQVKLLRFLQDGQIQRVGGRKLINVDCRILAATNIDLQAAMDEGKFREDLFYRLAVILLKIPPLRERGEDRTVLSHFFLQRFAGESSKKIKGFTTAARRAIESYTWPGNIRELENRVRRSVIMAERSRIGVSDLGLDSGYARYTGLKLREAREKLEKEMIEIALLKNNGNMSRAAGDLGISRPTLYEMIEKLEIQR